MLNRLLLAVSVLAVALVATWRWLDAREEREWEAYRVTHHCRIDPDIVGRTETRQSYLPSGTGMVEVPVIVTRMAWRCDDGEIRWR